MKNQVTHWNRWEVGDLLRVIANPKDEAARESARAELVRRYGEKDAAYMIKNG